MDRLHKWIILSSNIGGKRELDLLSARYMDIDGSDPRFHTPEAEALLSVLEKPPVKGVSILAYPDGEYPAKLRQLKNPPAVLYVKGNKEILISEPCVAVVGTREASAYGMTVTADFCRDFLEAGFTIVTGGARGIDSAAAQTAVKFGGKAIIVLGCGIDLAYPPENVELFRSVLESGGAVVSEFPYGTQPIPQLFPQRNRVIAALSDGCVVTEAGLRSGALITANYCLDLRRPLYAVPGNITSAGSAGTNNLIRSGAIMAADGMKVASELRLALSFTEKGGSPAASNRATDINRGSHPKKEITANKKIPGLSANEEKILAAIRAGYITPSDISRYIGLGETVLAPILVTLELKGVIELKFGGQYTIKV